MRWTNVALEGRYLRFRVVKTCSWQSLAYDEQRTEN